jgi:hypothetical protein
VAGWHAPCHNSLLRWSSRDTRPLEVSVIFMTATVSHNHNLLFPPAPKMPHFLTLCPGGHGCLGLWGQSVQSVTGNGVLGLASSSHLHVCGVYPHGGASQ